MSDSATAGEIEAHATEADVRACFRLLLGRGPHAEEWAGHSARVGEPLGAVVSSYVNSLEFHRRRLQDPDVGAAPQIAQLDGYRLLARSDDLAVGYHVLNGVYEPDVMAVFSALLRPGLHVIDIGANIGVFAMMAASRVGPTGSVLAVEPNPRNARMVEASRRLNGFTNMTVLQAAAGRETGLLGINTSFSNGTTAAIEDGLELSSESVACVALDRMVDRTHPIDLIKLDVEGAEFNALLGCSELIRRDRPAIIFEFSPGALHSISGVDGPGLLRWLVKEGYEFAVIHPDTTPERVGQDWALVMQAFQARGRDHIDVLAQPLTPRRAGSSAVQSIRRLWLDAGRATLARLNTVSGRLNR